MRLVKLQEGPSQWHDIREAASIICRGTNAPDMHTITTTLQAHYQNPDLTVSELQTGFNASRRGIVVCHDRVMTIAFFGSDPNELHMNMWTDAKGPNWWDLPYAVYENGNRVHSFYRDMWHAMRTATYDALSRAVEKLASHEAVPERIIITGFSMGGGISILAFTDVLEKIRSEWGSASPAPQSWAQDERLGSLVQHITFAAVAAGDQGHYTVLNDLYDKHQIRAWNFVNHRDVTLNFHHLAFRSWRGYQYILPDAVVRHFNHEFGEHSHNVAGYLKAAEWMADHGTDQVKTIYTY